MDDPSRTRWRGAASVGAVTVAVVALLLTFPSIAIFSPPGPAQTSTEWSVGSGLVTMGAFQQASAQAYWDTYCPPSKGYCMDPVGVAYVPSAQLVMLTELVDRQGGFGSANAFLEFDPGTLQMTLPVPLNCTPGVPFYPGVGVNVLVPCWNATTNLLAVDIQTSQVVASTLLPVSADLTSPMTYDPASGKVYWAASSPQMVMIDPESGTVVGSGSVPGTAFTPGLLGNAYDLVWNPAAQELVMPSAAGGLLAVNPTTWAVEENVSLPAPAVTLADDPATNQLFVSTTNITTWSSSVLVLNAATYSLEATLSIPNCVDNVCGEPNDVNQILFDPAYGDAYLVSTMAFFTLNLTTLTVLSALEDYGDGLQTSSVLVPGLERVFGTYEPTLTGPGFLVSVAHGSQSVLSQVLWLPTSAAVLLLAGATGTVLAFFRPGGVGPDEYDIVYAVFQSRKRERDPSEGEEFDLWDS